MKKSIKKVIIGSIILFSVGFNLTALDSASYEATAFTIQDDASSLMNVIDWKNLKFNKIFGFTNADSSGSGNLALFCHTKKKNVAGLSWEGNLWAESSYNTISAFYGWKDFAVKFDFMERISPTWYLDNFYCSDYKEFAGNASFGYNINKKYAFSVDFGCSYLKGNITQNNTKTNYITYSPAAFFIYTFKDDKKENGKFYVNYSGDFLTRTSVKGKKETVTNYSQNSLTLGVRYLNTSSKRFIYAFSAELPADLILGDDIPREIDLNCYISNGLSFIIKPDSVFFNTGIKISLPQVSFIEDQEIKTDNFYCDIYAGFSFLIASSIKIDLCTGIIAGSGITAPDIWNQDFKISISARF